MHPLTALDEFLSYLAAERGLSRNTLEGYGRDVRFFLGACSGDKRDLRRISTSDIVSYLGLLKGRGIASASIYRAFVALKVFFRFLLREGILVENPSLHLESPKLWQMIPDVLSREEMDLLLNAPDQCEEIGLRDAAAMLLLYATGMRVSELCGLKREEIQVEGIRVCGKGNKVRMIPVAEEAVSLARTYIEKSGEKKGAFLLSVRGYPLDRHQIWRRIKRYAKEVGLAKRVSPHTFRHTYATHLLDNGADLRVIQEFLGHSEISTTERYTHISKKHMSDAFTKFHPRG